MYKSDCLSMYSLFTEAALYYAYFYKCKFEIISYQITMPSFYHKPVFNLLQACRQDCYINIFSYLKSNCNLHTSAVYKEKLFSNNFSHKRDQNCSGDQMIP